MAPNTFRIEGNHSVLHQNGLQEHILEEAYEAL